VKIILKKTLSIITLIITFFIIYYLQTNFFSWFTIKGIMPNLFVIYVLYIGLFVGKKIGLVLGIIFGIIIDILLGTSIGITGLLLGIIGIVSEYLDKYFSKDSRITIMLIVLGGTVFFEIGYYIFKIIKWDIAIEIIPFLKMLTIESIFNVIITIIIYPIMQKTGVILEKIYKSKNNILTRYY